MTKSVYLGYLHFKSDSYGDETYVNYQARKMFRDSLKNVSSYF